MFDQYEEIWSIDFEYSAPPGERPSPHCLVCREVRSDTLIRQWIGSEGSNATCPIRGDNRVLIVTFYAVAEMSCYLALGWPIPINVLDLFCEFRNHTNGTQITTGRGLIHALAYFDLDAISGAEKEEFRQLAIRGGPYTTTEQLALLDYCQSDVDSTGHLLSAMSHLIDLPRALLRGRYMSCVAKMEHLGIPIDTTSLQQIRVHWDEIKGRLIRDIDRDYGVYSGTTFRSSRWMDYTRSKGIVWPITDSGRPALDDDTFKQFSERYPKEIGPIRELRNTLGQLRLNDLSVGGDQRNRCMLSPFQSRTGRNQPSNTKFVFGPAVWIRWLIKPTEGMAIAYIDWSQQEFGIAAALSGDVAMADAYASGDPYLTFAKLVGAVPADASKVTHAHERNRFKTCILGVQYGMGARSLAGKLGETVSDAEYLLQLHRQAFQRFWDWSEATVNHALLHRRLRTLFGWTLNVPHIPNTRSLSNFPCQANGSEILRVACCLLTDSGIRLLATVHDAVLIEAPITEIDEAVAAAQQIMQEAARIVLNGFVLQSDAEIVRYPNRFKDKRGEHMWDTLNRILDEVKNGT